MALEEVRGIIGNVHAAYLDWRLTSVRSRAARVFVLPDMGVVSDPQHRTYFEPKN